MSSVAVRISMCIFGANPQKRPNWGNIHLTGGGRIRCMPKTSVRLSCLCPLRLVENESHCGHVGDAYQNKGPKFSQPMSILQSKVLFEVMWMWSFRSCSSTAHYTTLDHIWMVFNWNFNYLYHLDAN